MGGLTVGIQLILRFLQNFDIINLCLFYCIFVEIGGVIERKYQIYSERNIS